MFWITSAEGFFRITHFKLVENSCFMVCDDGSTLVTRQYNNIVMGRVWRRYIHV